MPEIHVIQWSVVFLAAVWLTARWLMQRPPSRWRHIAVGIANFLLWVPVAYTAGNVGDSSGGETLAYGSDALAAVSSFMLVVCIGGIIIGLLLWVEEGVEETSDALPQQARRPGD